MKHFLLLSLLVLSMSSYSQVEPQSEEVEQSQETAAIEEQSEEQAEAQDEQAVDEVAVVDEENSAEQDKFSLAEIMGVIGSKAQAGTSRVIGWAIERYGYPSGVIIGKEVGAKLIVGYFKGGGLLKSKNAELNELPVEWNIPSIGFGGEISGGGSVFLIYGPLDESNLYQTYIGLKGSAHSLVGGGVQVLREKNKFTQDGAIGMVYINLGLGFGATLSLDSVTFTKKTCWFGNRFCNN